MKQNNSQAHAYVIPLPERILKRVFNENKRVIVKFLPNRSLRNRFQLGTKLVFYRTKSDRSLVGESSVLKVEMLLPNEAVIKYEDSLILSRTEIDSYVNLFPGRVNKKLLTLKVDNPRKYESLIEWPYHMTMVGRFLSIDEYNHIIQSV